MREVTREIKLRGAEKTKVVKEGEREVGGGGGDLSSRHSLRCRRGTKLVLAQTKHAQTNHARLSCRPLLLPAGVEPCHDRSLGIAHKQCWHGILAELSTRPSIAIGGWSSRV